MPNSHWDDPEDLAVRPHFKRFKTLGFQLSVAYLLLFGAGAYTLFASVPKFFPFNILVSWDLFLLVGYGFTLLVWVIHKTRKGASWRYFVQTPDLYCLILMFLVLSVPSLTTIVLWLRVFFDLSTGCSKCGWGKWRFLLYVGIPRWCWFSAFW